MNENIPYDTVLDLLVGDLKSKDELATVLNFLDHTKSIIRHLYWVQRLKNDMAEDKKFLGDLRSE
jgi:hypothetical protein